MSSTDDSARLEQLEREVSRLREAVEGTGASARTQSARPRKLRYLLVASGVLALTITGVATGVTGDTIKEGQRNPASGFASAETQLVSNNGTGYTTRLSNFNASDGGAQASGCRSATGNEPCLQLANLNTGWAFQVIAQGSEGGRIEVNGPNAKPFTTNATGVANGLNADRVDSLDASQLQQRVTGACSTAQGAIVGVNANGSVNCRSAGNLWARVTTFAGGGIFENLGTGTASWSGNVGRYSVTFPVSVQNCATVVTPNVGVNGGFFAVSQTVNHAYGVDPQTINLAFMNPTTGAFEHPFGFSVAVSC